MAHLESSPPMGDALLRQNIDLPGDVPSRLRVLDLKPNALAGFQV
jgi:hypothetical protein